MKIKAILLTALMAVVAIGDTVDAQRRSRSRSTSRPRISKPAKPKVSKPKPTTQRRTTTTRSKPTTTAKPSATTTNRNTKATKPSTTTARPATKPTASAKYDSKAATAARRSSSQASYQANKQKYTAKQSANRSRISSVSGNTGRTYSRNDFNTRDTRRQTVVYNTYVGRSYPGHWGGYNDGISPFFWMWMMSEMNSNQQAAYIHNHGASLDQARLNELYAQNAQLEAQVAHLRASGVAPDPSVLPEGMDAANADLMFSDDFAADAAGLNAPLPPEEDGLGFFGWFMILVGAGGIIFLFTKVRF
jgi:hypothetical protein